MLFRSIEQNHINPPKIFPSNGLAFECIPRTLPHNPGYQAISLTSAPSLVLVTHIQLHHSPPPASAPNKQIKPPNPNVLGTYPAGPIPKESKKKNRSKKTPTTKADKPPPPAGCGCLDAPRRAGIIDIVQRQTQTPIQISTSS